MEEPQLPLRRLHTNCRPAAFPLCPVVGRWPVKKPPASQQRGTPVCEAKSRSPCSAQSQQCFPVGLKFNPAHCSKGLEVQLTAPFCGPEWSRENPSPEVSCRNKVDLPSSKSLEYVTENWFLYFAENEWTLFCNLISSTFFLQVSQQTTTTKPPLVELQPPLCKF